MSGELRLAKPAVAWTLVGAVPAAGVAYLARGEKGAVSLALAVAIVLANATLAALLSAAAGKISFVAAGIVSFPSFLIRLAVIAATFSVLGHISFVDRGTLGVSFGVALVAVLALEARAWKRTPWIAMTFKEGSS